MTAAGSDRTFGRFFMLSGTYYNLRRDRLKYDHVRPEAGMIRILLLLLALLPAPTNAANAEPGFSDPLEHSGHATMIDEQGRVIFETGLPMIAGDQFIDEDNRIFEVVASEHGLAKARLIGHDAPTASTDFAVPVQSPAGEPGQLVAVYHTHTDESYIPSDGKSTVPGNGGIFSVGAAFAQRLREIGYQVEHNRTVHEPHDANAYHRSRRTVMKLLQLTPKTLFDFHRDSAPARVYTTRIDGKDATKVLLVVGRQNQNRKTTQEYARSIKATADAKYKGLIRGIFVAHGNYNQDLSPRAILVEIGTQYNSREAAETSAILFADVVPGFLAVRKAGAKPMQNPAPPAATDDPPADGRSELNDGFIILGVTVAGIAAYLFLSTGSWPEARRRLHRLMTVEFRDLFARIRRKRR